MNKVGLKISIAAIILALFASLLPQSGAKVQAISNTLVISQVYGGGGNTGAPLTHDFVEIFNRGSDPVSLGGLSIQYASATGTGNFGASTTQLTELPAVTLEPGQYFLIQEAGGTTGVPLPTPDLVDSTPIAMAATGGKVALVNSTTSLGCNGGSTPCSPDQLALIIDLVGYGSANFYEGAPAPAASNTTAVLRNSNGCMETDNNSADFAAAAPAPRNTSSPVNICPPADSAPQVLSTTPADGAVDVALDADLAVTFSEPVNLAGDWFSLSCLASGTHAAVVSGGPETFTLNPDVDFASNETCTLTVFSTQVADQDANDPPDNLVENFTAAFYTIATGPDDAPAVTAVTPSDGTTGVAVDANLSVSFSEPVSVAGDWYSLTCAASGAHTAVASGGPVSFTLDPDSSFTPGEACTLTILAAGVADQDSIDPPDSMSADFTSGFQVFDACAQAYTPISEIQGSGLTAAITGLVTTKGVVVGDYEYPGSGTTSNFLRGFFIQDISGDGNPATSDGIFVFNGSYNSVSLGDVVYVTGTSGEYQGQTQLSSVSAITACGMGTVDPVDVTFPVPSTTFLEQYEGMLVRLPQTMVVTEHYLLGRFGQVTLSVDARLQQPTNVTDPGAPALALQAENDLKKILLDDGTNLQNPDPIVFGRGGLPLSASNTLRGGDTATGIVGVLNYTWGGNSASPNAYRVRPVNALSGWVDFVPANLRPETPAETGGELKVVGMNLLNYFNTFDGLPDSVDNCTLGVGGTPTDCRGADTQSEFDRQWPKSVAAILAIDPDIIGVNEIENDGYAADSAIQDLVDRLNAATASGTYAFIDVDAATGEVNALGTDAIKVGMIFKPAKVTPLGAAALNSVEFVNGGDTSPRSRPALAVTYEQVSDGAVFTVVANHLKSKGSACDLPDAGDGQGNCNIVRTNAANTLAAWLATYPTGTTDPDVLIIGDLNSYAKEDPITALKNAGYTNLVEAFVGPDAYSYVFDGQWGYLDHSLANNSLLSQVTGVVEYHVNSDEPSVLDYNTNFKTDNLITTLYAPDQYRNSDHDPLIVGLNLNAAPFANAGGPYEVNEGSQVTIQASGSDPDGDALVYAWDLDNNGDFETAGQEAVINGIDGPATFTLKVKVTDPGGLSAIAETSLTVNNVNPLVGEITLTKDVVAVNQAVSASVAFTDPGILDTHSAVWDWGDGTTSPATIDEASGSGTASGSHPYAAAGFYPVTLTVTDKDGGAGQVVYQDVIVYNPNGGFLSGSGIIDSPSGAYLSDPDLTGRAVFSVAAKYIKNKNLPTGATTFFFPKAKLMFISTAYEWLVVSPDLKTAQLKGKGSINGKGNYQFMLWAEDGSPDSIRIKIWYEKNGSEVVVYDNGTTQALLNGAIVIHR